MPSLRLLAPALFALALCGTPPSASAQSFSDGQRGDIETIVRNYLLAHPEVPLPTAGQTAASEDGAKGAAHAHSH
jgi:hypothetical protein